MCRTGGRRCEAHWAASSRQTYNAKRRVVRNTERAENARAAGDLDKAAEYDRLRQVAVTDVATATSERTRHDVDVDAQVWRDSWTDTETDAVDEYSGIGHYDLNAKLRGENTAPLTEDEQATVTGLDTALARAPHAGAEHTVYRGISFRATDGADAARTWVDTHCPDGATVTFDGYTSTTTDEDTATYFTGVNGEHVGSGVVFTITTRSGALMGDSAETEVMLGRGSQFTVVDRSSDTVNGKPVERVTLRHHDIPGAPAPAVSGAGGFTPDEPAATGYRDVYVPAAAVARKNHTVVAATTPPGDPDGVRVLRVPDDATTPGMSTGTVSVDLTRAHQRSCCPDCHRWVGAGHTCPATGVTTPGLPGDPAPIVTRDGAPARTADTTTEDEPAPVTTRRTRRTSTTPPVTPTPAPGAGGAGHGYQTWHVAPGDEGEDGVNAPLTDLTRVYPPDVYDKPDHYPGGDEETIRQMRAVRGNPDALVTVYRAVPDGVEHINRGDWVTLSSQYAHKHLAGNLRSGRVLTAQVPASQLWTDANNLAEYGYDGPQHLHVPAE